MTIDYDLHKKLLYEVIEGGMSWAHGHGYEWFHDIYLPVLDKAAELSLISQENLSACYYIAGDVIEVNDAPKKALEYYFKALTFDPDCAATYREIARMFETLGKYSEALEYSDKALALDPDDEHAQNDRQVILMGGPPFYEEDDILWKVCEHLANREVEDALKLLENTNNEGALRGKIYCHGALNEPNKYLKTWSELTKISDEIDLNLADWFYMPNHIYEATGIWTTLLSSEVEFSGFGGNIESLAKNETYLALNTNEQIRLSFQYEKYKTSKNIDGLKSLLDVYPEWVELREHLHPS